MSALLIAILITVLVLAVLAVGNVAVSARTERSNPPIGKFIECGGVRLHYIDRGNLNRPAVVLFHGNGSMIQDLVVSGTVDALVKCYRVLCFDRPGFGYSTRPRKQRWTPERQAELFASALKKLRIENPVVFGHSSGAFVALALALQREASVRALILVSGYYFPTLRFGFCLLSSLALPIFGDIAQYTLAPITSFLLLSPIIRTLFVPRPVPMELKGEFPLSLCLRPKQLRAAAEETAFHSSAASRLRSQYELLTCPVKLIHGGSDRLIEPAQSMNLQKSLKRSVIEIVEGAGHMVHHSDPNLVLRAVDELRSLAYYESYR